MNMVGKLSTSGIAKRPALVGTGRFDPWLVVVAGLGAYQVVKAAMWIRAWPSVVALFTNADHEIYYQAALRIRAGGPVYPEFQLAGPYSVMQLPELYPPPTVLGLFVPMSFLPAVLWWAIPLAIIVAVVWHWRPSLAGWTLILACLSVERTWVSIAAGNPAIWVTAAIGVGTLWRPAFVFVLMKPTLAPFVLPGARSRGFWALVALGSLASLAMLPLWGDWITTIRNLRSEANGLDNLALPLIPLIAWSTSRFQPRHPIMLVGWLARP